MSWQDRQYSNPGHYEPGGGLRSWLGGLPAPGRAIKWIMAVNIALWLLVLLSGRERSPIYQWLAMRTDLVLEGQVWRLLTFAYMHDPYGIGHIVLNMFGLYMLGMYLERGLGSRRFFVFYTAGGIAAVGLYLLVTLVGWLDRDIPLVGASGNVFAVLGATAVLYPAVQLIFFFFPVPIRPMVLILTLLFGFNLISRGVNAGGDACHLAGMAFGVAWGYGGRGWMRRWDELRSGMRQRAAQSRRQREADMQEEVDRILAKVHEQGIQSLTEREKRVLAEATREKQRY